MTRFRWRHLDAILLAMTAMVFILWPQLDLVLARRFYVPGAGFALWQSWWVGLTYHAVARFWMLAPLLAGLLLLSLRPRWRRHRLVLGYLLAVLLLGPGLIANTVLMVSVAIFDETALAFLGLGDPTRVSWGTLIEAAGSSSAASTGAWWAIIPPGIAVGVLCLALMMWGTAIEDTLNPRLKVSHLSAHFFRLRSIPVRKGAE